MLEEALVPAYLFHRYQAEAAIKLLGGVGYGYGTEAADRPRVVDPGLQRDAMRAVLSCAHASRLVLPESILASIPPRPPGYDAHRELFERHTGVTFDPLAAAESAAAFVFRLVLEPARAARLVEHHARDATCPSLEEVIEEILVRTWLRPSRSIAVADEVERVVDRAALAELLDLAENPSASGRVRSAARHAVASLPVRLARTAQGLPEGAYDSHLAWASETIRRYFEDPEHRPGVVSLPMPPGSPIGGCCGP